MKGLEVVKSIAKSGALKVKKYSPEILLVGGIVGMVTGVVMACNATLKAEEVIDEYKENKEKIEEAKAVSTPEEYTDQDVMKDKTIIFMNAMKGFVKIYWKAGLVIISSIIMILGSHGIMSKRNAALGCLCEALNADFSAYRDAVKEKYGDEIDRELHYGMKAEKIEKDITDDAGKKKKIKETVTAVDAERIINSPYARFFDDVSREYNPNDPGSNKDFVLAQQRFANQKFQAEHFLMLNDIYDALDIPRSTAGAKVGWIDWDYFTPEEQKAIGYINGRKGDNFIDFGIFNVHRKENREFVNGIEPCILLDFNVDGVIDEKIDTIMRILRRR